MTVEDIKAPTAATAIAVVCGLFCLAIMAGVYPIAWIDDLVLYNPIHIWLTTGRWAFPVQWQYDGFAVHPPFRYFEIALLMWSGMSYFISVYIVPAVLTLVATLLLAALRWRPPVKIAAAVAMVSTWALMFYAGMSLRPDAHAAIAFVAALFAIELARQRQFSWIATVFAATLFAYASVVHYHLSAAFLGMAVLLPSAYRAGTLSRTLKATTLGITIIFAPYLIYIFWNWGAFQFVLSLGGASLGSAGRWQNHSTLYNSVARELANGPQPVLRFLFDHARWLVGFSPLLAAAGFLLWRDSWLVGAASLPAVLFVLAQSRKNWWYLFPEYFVFAFGALLIVAGAIHWIAILLRRVGMPRPVMALPVIAMLLVLAFGPMPHRLAIGGNHVYEADIARASSKAAIGNGRLIGGRMGLWYVSGATRWYDISADILWNDNRQLDLPVYFNRFDYIVEHAYWAEGTLNTPRANVANWYRQKLLTLAGFYIGTNSTISFARFAHRQEPIVGHVWRDGALRRFEAAADEAVTLVSAFCGKDNATVIGLARTVPMLRIGLPRGGEVALLQMPPGPQELVLALFESAEIRHLQKVCHIQETVPGRYVSVELATILLLAETSRNPVDFEIMRRSLREEK